MKRFISLILLILSASAAFAQQKLLFTPSEWDFGSVREEDGRVTHTFTGENRGDKPLVILDVVTTCGCTVPAFSKQPILPGGKTRITVTFDPENRPGSFTKQLSVYSSDREKVAVLTIRGEVTPRPKSIEELYPVAAGEGLRLSGTLCAFSYIYSGVPKQMSIGYVNTSDRPLRLELRPQVASGLLAVDAPQSIAPGERGEIGLGYRMGPQSPRYGTIRDVLEPVVDGRSTGLALVVHGIGADNPADTPEERAPKSEISGNIVKFGPVKRTDASRTQEFTLSNTGRGDLIVRAVECGGHVGVSLASGARIAPGRSLRVEVRLDPRGADFGPLTDRVVLITNDPLRPMRRLRVTAIVED